MTSTNGSGGSAGCERYGTSHLTFAIATTEDVATVAAGLADLSGSNGAVAAASAVGTESGTVILGVDARIPEALATAIAYGSSAHAAAATGTSMGGNTAHAATLAEFTGSENARAASVALADPSRGILGTASRASAEGPNGSAEALAIGLSGLTDSISESDGGMAANINLRFDHQTEANWLLGAEVDFTATSGSDGRISSETTIEAIDSAVEVDRGFDVDTNMLASARLRLGYAMGDFLIYGTGGAAYTEFDATYTETGSYDGLSASRSTRSKSADAFGGVIGGGLSAFVSDNAVITVEGLYYHFDEEIDFGDDASVTFDKTFSVMTKFSIRTN